MSLSTVPTVPVNLVASVLSSQSIRLSWEPPIPPNGVITEYRLSVTLVNVGSERRHTVCGAETEFLVTQLPANQLVSVALSATTSVGTGPAAVTQATTADAGLWARCDGVHCHAGGLETSPELELAYKDKVLYNMHVRWLCFLQSKVINIYR